MARPVKMSIFCPTESLASSNMSVATLTTLLSVNDASGVRAILTLNGVFMATIMSLAWLYAMRCRSASSFGDSMAAE